jgi:hypothetical protein
MVIGTFFTTYIFMRPSNIKSKSTFFQSMDFDHYYSFISDRGIVLFEPTFQKSYSIRQKQKQKLKFPL